MLLGYDYNYGNAYKYGNCTLLWRMDKNSITCKSTDSLVIGTGNICRNKMVCERLAGSKRVLLKKEREKRIVS